MHGISFGSTNLPYRFGPANNGSGQQGVARGDYGHDRGSSSISQGGILSNLRGSISNLRSQLESLSTSRDLPIDWSGEVSASGMGAQVINKQRGELQIHTQDGDVVTLKFSSKVGVRIEGQQISDGTTTLTDASMDVYSRSKIKMSVEGELSDAELTAINNLVDKVGDLTNEFFNGDMDNVLAQAMNLSYDSSVLADYSLDLSLKQSVRAYAYTAVWSPPQQVAADPVVDETPVAVPATDDSTPVAVDEVAAAPVETPAATISTAALGEDSSTTPTTSTDTPADSSATQIVAEFVAKIRSSFHMTATEQSLGMSYEFKVKLLISSIAESAPAEAKPDSVALDYLREQLEISGAA